MLRTTCSNISIITDFGCNNNCFYCIWKKHPCSLNKQPMDWYKLRTFLCEHKNVGYFSISGGGDPLFRPERNVKWWKEILQLADNLKLNIKLHTREKYAKRRFWRKHIYKCAFSSDIPSKDLDWFTYLSWHTNLRIVHVVTEFTDSKKVEEYLTIKHKLNCELTFKQLVNFDDKGNFNKLQSLYPEEFFLEKGDYNLYYMPDNTIRTKFLE